MALDPYSRVFKPDFQADQSLPEWVPMGDNGDQGDQIASSTGSFVDLLKKRMAGGAAGSAKGSAMPGMEGKAMGMGGGGAGGGMQSL